MDNKERNICVAIPHTGWLNWQVFTSNISLQLPPNTRLKYNLVGNCLIYDARERMAEYAMAENCDYILYLDSDMVLPSDAIMKMVNVLESTDYEVVTGMAFKRIPPFQPCFYTKVTYDAKEMKPCLESPVEFPDEGLLQLQGAGMACCMLKTSVFKQIPKPWFYPLPNLGEDLTFCIKMKQAGIKMCVDLTIDVGHIAIFPVGKEHFTQCYNDYKASQTTEPLFREV